MGGEDNIANSTWSSIGGGQNNRVTSDYSTVAGGFENVTGGAEVFGGIGLGNSIGGGVGTSRRGLLPQLEEAMAISRAVDTQRFPGVITTLQRGSLLLPRASKQRQTTTGHSFWADDTDSDFCFDWYAAISHRAENGVGINTNSLQSG